METWTSFFARRTARRGPHWLTAALLILALLMASMGVARAAETITYYYTSPQGTVLATTDSAGNVLTSTDYRPYGSQALGTPEDGPGYTGHVNDTASGLVYMQARYYDPDVARFVSTDPKPAENGRPEVFSRFAYAQNNPIRFIDPDGKQSWCTPGNCGAASYLKASNDVTYFRENYDVVAEVKGAYGPGLEVNYNLSQARGEVNFVPVAQGIELSIYAQPKTPIVVPIVDQPTAGKMAMSWGAGADVAAIVKLGLDVKYDPGGKFELTPKAGFGAGEFQQFSPSINLLEWQNSPEDDRKRTNE